MRVELAAQCRLEDSGDDDRHHHGREGELHIGKAHQQVIDPATGIAGKQADDDPQHQLQADGKHPDGQRDPRAVQHGTENIAPLVVGPQQEALIAPFQPGGRQLGIHDVVAGLIVGIMGGNPGRKQRQRHITEEDGHADHGYLVLEKVVNQIGLANAGPTAESLALAHGQAPLPVRLTVGLITPYSRSTRVLVTTKIRPTKMT